MTGATIHVGDISANTTGAGLSVYFSAYGLVLRTNIVKNQHNRFGFVTMRSREEAEQAILSGPHEIDGVIVTVRSSFNKEEAKAHKQKIA